MSNINGKVYAMNAITPMKPWKTWIVRGLMFVLSGVKSSQKDLINLSFIEFARWVIVPRKGLPFLGHGQQKEELKYDYLLFFSNFNGTWNQYIDAFSAVLSQRLNLVWRWSEKFPGSRPVTLFKQYIAHVQFDTDYYYVAYRLVSIGAGLLIHDRFRHALYQPPLSQRLPLFLAAEVDPGEHRHGAGGADEDRQQYDRDRDHSCSVRDVADDQDDGNGDRIEPHDLQRQHPALDVILGELLHLRLRWHVDEVQRDTKDEGQYEYQADISWIAIPDVMWPGLHGDEASERDAERADDNQNHSCPDESRVPEAARDAWRDSRSEHQADARRNKDQRGRLRWEVEEQYVGSK